MLLEVVVVFAQSLDEAVEAAAPVVGIDIEASGCVQVGECSLQTERLVFGPYGSDVLREALE
jgi:hypothetical protein